jgi:hypothetical protein
MHYLEELGQNLPSNFVSSSSPKEERSEEGNTMRISLYERSLEYRRIFEQSVQTLFPRFQCRDGDFFSKLLRKGGRIRDNH